MPAPSTNQELFALIAKSGVMDEARLKEYLRTLTAADGVPADPTKLADRMVRDGLLSVFQSENLLQGRWKRFFIGKYKVLERLGAGGMGQVFLCEHKLMKRKVAVKVLPAAKAKDAASLQRFYREARAVAAMDHPNLVRAYDIDQDGDLHFIVMEYVDGTNLHDLVRVSGPLPPLRAAHYVSGTAVGLHHAHEMGLVHRDIKPANVLVDRAGVVKILDMGLARFFNPDDDDHLTKKYDENVLGTADYLAPEQAVDSTAVDIRADIYGLGCTFYFLLVGGAPFAEGSVATKLLAHQNRDPKPITAYRSDVPAGLLAVVAKMMAKRPEDRYQTPAELLAALTPWVQTPIAPPSEHELPQLSIAAGGSGRPSPRSAAPFTLPNDLDRQPTKIDPTRSPDPPTVPRAAAPVQAKSSTPPAAPNVWASITAMETTPPTNHDTAKNRVKPAAADYTEAEVDDPPSRPRVGKGGKGGRTRLILALVVGGLMLVGGGITAAVLVFKPFGPSKVESTGPGKEKDKENEPRTWYVTASGTGPDQTTTRKTLSDIGNDLKPGDRIVLLDDTLETAPGPIRLKNVRLEAGNAAKSVTWKYKPGNTIPAAALEINGGENMIINGLVIDAGGQVDIGVLIAGGGRGVVLDRVTVKGAKKVGIRVSNAAAESGRPLKIDGCRVIGGPTLEAAVHVTGSNRAGTSGVEICGSRFEGTGAGAVFRVEGGVSNCLFRNNRAYHFAIGVLVPLAGDQFDVTVERNTFHTLKAAGVQVDQALADDRKLTISRNYFAATAEVGKVAGDANRVTATDNCRDAGSRLGDLAATILSGFALPKPTADTPTDKFLPSNNRMVVGDAKVAVGAE